MISREPATNSTNVRMLHTLVYYLGILMVIFDKRAICYFLYN